ncbi:imidazolonepropionase [Bacteroidales bacterium OttesenSCG-928-K03]|nr:imidazolonepropionase [Bacteroidales bacterium OttesenSCG-928-L14]MDL2240343.1 imidazolonepropionase [Bacteroidales bacterium OttesenSCG-928-K22]MDL2242496.1 imidazolonepropionase [Bacteroidales bacterium OttesenSCG-928-K03]
MIIITNIKKLVGIDENGTIKFRAGAEMEKINIIDDAFLVLKDEKIHSFGEMNDLDLESLFSQNDLNPEIIDATDKFVLPAWCDSHTHIVYAQSREIEYVDKIKGLSYEEIAARGGGILNSAKKLHETSEDDLYKSTMQRLELMASFGTGAVEIKSGYGLTTDSELKMLRVIKRLKENSPLTIKSNFLGAHSIPLEYRGKQDEYVDIIINEMLPRVAEEKLADFVDVFCDKGFFTVEDTARILEAAAKYGIRPKIHANELGYTGGIQVGVKYNALSVDHLEFTGDDEINALLGSQTMPTILPGAAFFLNMIYAPARDMIEAGLPIAMASDFNPGSSPSGNMQLIISMASILYKLTPIEAINAVTINTAYAMGVEKELGTITVGKKANVLITKKIPSLEYIPYAYGENKIERVIIKGK